MRLDRQIEAYLTNNSFLVHFKSIAGPWLKQCSLIYIVIGAIILDLLWLALYFLTIDRWLRKIVGRHYGITLKPESIALNSWYGWKSVDANNRTTDNHRDRWVELIGSILCVPVVFVPPIIGILLIYWLRH
jgi:hypothetical protein